MLSLKNVKAVALVATAIALLPTVGIVADAFLGKATVQQVGNNDIWSDGESLRWDRADRKEF